MKIEIAIDFDGTVVTHEYPNLGKDIGAIPVLQDLVKAGHKLILNTMRCNTPEDRTAPDGYKMYGGNYLTQAVKWFQDNDIELYGVQANPTQHTWTKSRKCHANLYIDDLGLGMPLINDPKISDRPFVNWTEVRKLLEDKGIL